ncbi:MAG: hypothetical protein ACOC2H_04970 [Spirochaetota bacterium]
MNMPLTEKINQKDLKKACKDDVYECDKHDLIAQIATMIDCRNPGSLCKAEEIFDQMKYSIAHFIMKHEFGPAYYSNEDMYFKMEEKAQPAAVDQLNSVIDKYLL